MKKSKTPKGLIASESALSKPTSAPAERTGQPRPVGAPRRFKKEDYQAIKLAMQDCTLAGQTVQQTAELAQRAMSHARELHSAALARMQKLSDRFSLPDGGFLMNDDRCEMQRVE